MDFHTVKFYMDTLLANGPVRAVLEINSNSAIDNAGFIEVMSSNFPIPPEFKLVCRTPTVNIEFGNRYMQSLYIKKS